MHTRLSQLWRRGASASAMLLWLLAGGCLNPRPDDLPAGAESAESTTGTPVNAPERATPPSPNAPADAPPPGSPTAAGEGEPLYDNAAAASQDAGVPADAAAPANADRSVDAGR